MSRLCFFFCELNVSTVRVLTEVNKGRSYRDQNGPVLVCNKGPSYKRQKVRCWSTTYDCTQTVDGTVYSYFVSFPDLCEIKKISRPQRASFFFFFEWRAILPPLRPDRPRCKMELVSLHVQRTIFHSSIALSIIHGSR